MKNLTSEEKLKLQFKGFLATPPLWKEKDLIRFPEFLMTEVIRDLKVDLKIPANLVLGRRIEYFFRYYIDEFSRHRTLAANLQIIQEKITLGELDFLLQDKISAEISHVELVYKFYLYDPSISTEMERWIGPNRRDSLVRKLDRLTRHQFPLLYRKETRETLKSLQIDPQEVSQKICFKAHLFLPYSQPDLKPTGVNAECISGRWLHYLKFTKREFGDHLFYLPKKENWPVDPKFNKQWLDYEEIYPQLQHLLLLKHAPLIWMKTGVDSFDRIFVVWW